jgi:hypothetical protein
VWEADVFSTGPNLGGNVLSIDPANLHWRLNDLDAEGRGGSNCQFAGMWEYPTSRKPSARYFRDQRRRLFAIFVRGTRNVSSE